MNKLVPILAVAALAFGLSACHRASPETAKAPAMKLKLYHVPTQDSRHLVQALHSVLAGNTARNIAQGVDNGMRVTSPFPGTVMVLAPEDLQRSIRATIRTLSEDAKNARPDAAKIYQYHVHFWVVQAKAGAGPDDAALKPLAPTLQRIRASLGPSHFVLEEAVSSVSRYSNQAAFMNSTGKIVTNHHHRFEFNAGPSAGGLIDLGVKYQDQTKRTFPLLDTDAIVRSGHYLVLAQGPSTPGAKPDSGDRTLMNLLVVQVDQSTESAH
jgi:hypothetical protein